MENNKQNTALLIVIAVATLLVAVVGATFAYFTATGNQGSTSAIEVKSGKMVIAFSDGSNAANLTANNFQPSSKVLIDKSFTLTGTNTATEAGGLTMPFKVSIKMNNEFSTGQLIGWFRRTDTSNQAVATLTGTAEQSIPGLTGTDKYYMHSLANGETTLQLATGYFVAGANGAAITFNFKLTFPDTGKNQDTEKGKAFTGAIEVSADAGSTTAVGA